MVASVNLLCERTGNEVAKVLSHLPVHLQGQIPVELKLPAPLFNRTSSEPSKTNHHLGMKGAFFEGAKLAEGLESRMPEFVPGNLQDGRSLSW